jgi:predicted dehydrogenase
MRVLLLPFAMAALFLQTFSAGAQENLRVGIIGLDTSHVTAFTRLLNDPSGPDHVPGARVVAAFKGGSPDVESSANRIEGFTAELRDKWKIEIVPTIAQLAAKVDAVLVESVDGRVHLEQVKPVLEARKRVFIDKPLAASYEDAREIARLAAAKGVAWFSSSSLRFYPGVVASKRDPKLGELIGATVHGPSPTEPHHPDLFWYGIHGVEMLYALMGTGCESVTRVNTPGADVVVGRWSGGRLGVFRGIRDGKADYGGFAYGRSGIIPVDPARGSYRPLLEEIIKFFKTGIAPVPPVETLEILAFMQAAELSKKRSGQAVQLSEITGAGKP